MKNIFGTFLFTGLGYLATLLYTYVVLNTVSDDQIGVFNRYESFLAILISLVSLGVVQDASRNIALNPKNWFSIYAAAQQLRFKIAIMISCLGILLFIFFGNDLFLLGCLGIAVALSGEFVFYALGRPVEGSLAALFRSITYSLVIISGVFFWGNLTLITVALAFGISFCVCGVFTSYRLNLNYLDFSKQDIKSSVISVGYLALLIFVYNNIKPAYIFLIFENLSELEKVYYFEAFRIFFLLFSVRRVTVQVFYRKIIQHPHSFKYDAYIALSVIFVLASFWSISFGVRILDLDIKGLSSALLFDVTIMAALMCFFPSSFTKLFGLKRDYLVAVPVISGAIWVLVGALLLQKTNSSVSHYLYLLASTELLMSCVSFFVVVKLAKNKSLILFSKT